MTKDSSKSHIHGKDLYNVSVSNSHPLEQTDRMMKGKKHKVDGALTAYWIQQLKECASELEDPLKVGNELLATVQAELTRTFDGDQQIQYGQLGNIDEAVLMEDISAERKRIKREESKFREKQKKLQAEQDRLQNFKRAQIAQEKEESEAISAFHPWAQNLASGKRSDVKKLPVAVRNTLSLARIQAASEADDDRYEPENDDFLQQLVEQLEPILCASRTASGR